ncbi:RHS repeat-associated core domain-containing protein [Pseudomonas sp. BJa5]|uniref:RHS repeat-associated core domain-containing protein n=1 Tax=Pseudomonas sp. BJa5 TaxID=2936270 RepID=UPI0025597531|nr:RHS repeat-associated core domain-containing protein [Pseudomonas sp. BGr12]MDL2422214.1 hypothetical protein [Pseudomonas sp. BGr12]
MTQQLWSDATMQYANNGFNREYSASTLSPWVSDCSLSFNCKIDNGTLTLPAPQKVSIHAYLINSTTGKMLEHIKYAQKEIHLNPASWSYHFCNHINSTGKHLKAGTWNGSSLVALEDTETNAEVKNNRLWHYGHENRSFTTNPVKENWVEALRLEGSAQVEHDSKIWVEVRDIRSQRLYECIEHTCTSDSWPTALCEQINRESNFLRAGRWSSRRSTWNAEEGFKPHAEENALWVPQGSDLAVTVSRFVDDTQVIEPEPDAPLLEKSDDLKLKNSQHFRLSDISDFNEPIAAENKSKAEMQNTLLRAQSIWSTAYIPLVWVEAKYPGSIYLTEDWGLILKNQKEHTLSWRSPSNSVLHPRGENLLSMMWLKDIRLATSCDAVERLVWMFEVDESLARQLNTGRTALLLKQIARCLSVEGEYLVSDGRFTVPNNTNGHTDLVLYKPSMRVGTASDGPFVQLSPANGQSWHVGIYRFYIHLADSYTGTEVAVADVGLSTETELWKKLETLRFQGHPQKAQYQPTSHLCEDYGNTVGSDLFDTEGETETGVNPQTGLFHSHYPVATLHALEAEEGSLDLTLHYSALRGNEAGLGDGWAFQFSSFENRERCLKLYTGEVIRFTDEEWANLKNGEIVKRSPCWVSSNADASEMTIRFPSGKYEYLTRVSGQESAEHNKQYLAQLKAMTEKVVSKELYSRIDQTMAKWDAQRSTWQRFCYSVEKFFKNSNPDDLNAWEIESKKDTPLSKQLKRELAIIKRPFMYLLPTTIYTPQGGSFHVQWECVNWQYLLKKISSANAELFSADYSKDAVELRLWPNTALLNLTENNESVQSSSTNPDSAFKLRLKLNNYLLEQISRSDTGSFMRYGYAPDPTLDHILVSVESSSGQLERVSYLAGAMCFPDNARPPLPAVAVHSISEGSKLALVTYYEYSKENYLSRSAEHSTELNSDSNVRINYTFDKHNRRISEIHAHGEGQKSTRWNYPDKSHKNLDYAQVSSIETIFESGGEKEQTTQYFEYNLEGKLSKSIAADGTITCWWYYPREGGNASAGLEGDLTALYALGNVSCPSTDALQDIPLSCMYEYQVLDGDEIPNALKFYGYEASRSGQLEVRTSVVINGITRNDQRLALAKGRRSARVQTVSSGLTTPIHTDGQVTWSEYTHTVLSWNGMQQSQAFTQHWREDGLHRYKSVVVEHDGVKVEQQDVEVYCRFSRHLLAKAVDRGGYEIYRWDSEGRKLHKNESWPTSTLQKLKLNGSQYTRQFDSQGRLLREQVDNRLVCDNHYSDKGLLLAGSEYEYLPGGLLRALHAGTNIFMGALWQATTQNNGRIDHETDAEITSTLLGSTVLSETAQHATTQADGSVIVRDSLYLPNIEGAVHNSLRHFDPLGRLVKHERVESRQVATIEYDELDRPVVFVQPDGTRIERVYYGLSNAVEKLLWVTQEGDGHSTVVPLIVQTFANGKRSQEEMGSFRFGYTDGQVTLPDMTSLSSQASPQGSTLTWTKDGSVVDQSIVVEQADNLRTVRATSPAGTNEQTIDGLRVGTFEHLVEMNDKNWQVSTSRRGPRAEFQGKVQCSSRGLWQSRQSIAGPSARAFRDAQDRVVCLIEGNLVQRFEYDDRSQLERHEVFDGQQRMVRELQWDDLGQETRRSYSVDGAVQLVLEREYHASGQLKMRRTFYEGELRLTETFDYDALTSRLARYHCSGVEDALPTDDSGYRFIQQDFVHDALGNLRECATTYSDQSTRMQTYTYDQNHPTLRIQELADGQQCHLGYDANGRLSRDSQGRHLQYNQLGRLVRVTNAKGSLLTRYDYDAENRLAAVYDVEQQRTCELLYELDGELAAEVWFDENHQELHRTCFFGMAQQTLTADQVQTTFVFQDPHSGVIGVTGAPPISFGPYGEHDGACPTARGYNGQWRDPVLGGYHLGNRYYDPVERCFYQRDGWSPLGAGGINDRAYCGGDPVNLHDPSGHIMLSRWGQEHQLSEMNKLIASFDPPQPPVDDRPWHVRMMSTLIWGGVAILGATAAVLLAIPTGGASLVIAGALFAATVVSVGLHIASEAIRYTNPKLSSILGGISTAIDIATIVPSVAYAAGRLIRWSVSKIGKLATRVQAVVSSSRAGSALGQGGAASERALHFNDVYKQTNVIRTPNYRQHLQWYQETVNNPGQPTRHFWGANTRIIGSDLDDPIQQIARRGSASDVHFYTGVHGAPEGNNWLDVFSNKPKNLLRSVFFQRKPISVIRHPQLDYPDFFREDMLKLSRNNPFPNKRAIYVHELDSQTALHTLNTNEVLEGHHIYAFCHGRNDERFLHMYNRASVTGYDK